MNDLDIVMADIKEIGSLLWNTNVGSRSKMVRRVQRLRPNIRLAQGKGFYLLVGQPGDSYTLWDNTSRKQLSNEKSVQ